MTLINYEVYVAFREAGVPDDRATACAAAVLHRPFTDEDAELIRQTFLDRGVSFERADAEAKSPLQEHLR
jgi:hypothetical protein